MTRRRPALTRRRGCLALVTLALPLCGRARSGRAASLPFKIIVHPSNHSAEPTRKFVADAFLKKVTRWPNDEVIRPADQLPDSAVRRRFTEDVLSRSVAAVKSYWQQIIFSGRGVPPPELSSDDEVVKYVLEHEGGLGYVSADAAVGGARVVGLQ